MAITPTYSGCPATAVIDVDIETHCATQGVENMRLERRLSPPWTTDWMTEAGREKLRAYGIAPPVDGTAAARMASLLVRRGCGRSNLASPARAAALPRTERVSQFGSTPCKAP